MTAVPGVHGSRRDASHAEGRRDRDGAMRILLVEDHLADAVLLEEHLLEAAEFPFEIRHVESLRAAREALRAFAPDVVVLDLTLPDSRGLATFRAAQAWDDDAPVVILSGVDDKHLALEAVRKGAQDYLLKDAISGPVLARVLQYAIERSRTEREIAARERRWRAMIQHSSDVVALVDRNLAIRYVSESIREAVGYQPDELVGGSALEIIHPDDHEVVLARLADVEGGAWSVKLGFRLRARVGAWRCFEAVATNLLDDPAVDAIVVNARDVTERRAAEAETERQKRILQAAVESLPGIYYLVDERPRFRMWNRNLEEVTGCRAEELPDTDPLDLVEEREAVAGAVIRVFREGSATVDAHVIAQDGRRIPHYFTGQRFVLDGEPLLAGFALDMTERKEAERQMEFQASLLAQVQNAVIATDAEGVVTYWNAFAEKLYGWTRDEAVGRKILDVNVPESERDAAAAILSTVADAGRWQGECVVRHKDGSTFPAWTTLARTHLGDGEAGFVGVSYDIREAKEAEERNRALTADLSRQVSHLNTLHKISDAIISSVSLDHTLSVILDQVRRELGVDAADVLVFDDAVQTLRFAAAKGFRTSLIEKTALRLGEGMAGKVALRRRPVFVPDVTAPDVSFHPPELVDVEGLVSYASLPLVAKGELQGILGMFHRSELDMSEGWLDAAASIARQAAIAIDNARLFEDLQRSNVELQLSHDRTIEGWARALDLRDEETAGHSKRVTDMTVALAERLGIAGAALADVRRGALLHDIGKMGVPDSVLLKPGKLDAGEWEVMKRHTTYARDFLAGVPFLERALDIPYAHHEKWDGSGYPRGLVGEEIPLAARIFAVVDVFDALTSDRPYRSAWSRGEALAHIRAEAGTHFDPRVVEAFLELMESRDGAGAGAR